MHCSIYLSTLAFCYSDMQYCMIVVYFCQLKVDFVLLELCSGIWAVLFFLCSILGEFSSYHQSQSVSRILQQMQTSIYNCNLLFCIYSQFAYCCLTSCICCKSFSFFVCILLILIFDINNVSKQSLLLHFL